MTIKPINIQTIGEMPDGTLVKEFTLTNQNGMSLKVINLGGIITSVSTPDKNGVFQDIILGYSDSADYILGNPNYFGAIIGPYANRIAGGKFKINHQVYNLEVNDGENTLHGGNSGFHNQIWDVEILQNTVFQTLKLTYISPDGKGGFPGNLKVIVYYTLTNNDELQITYQATTDKTSIINLTQHAYFNLSGDFSKEILDHECQFNASSFIPIDKNAIPLGNVKSVENSAFDFRISKKIGEHINSEEEQIQVGKGYDHTMVMDGDGFRYFGEIFHTTSGRVMQIFSDQSGFQLYSGNHLESDIRCKTDEKLKKRTGFCIETQAFPDSPNQAEFPKFILNPNETYRTKTVFKFLINK